LRHDPEFRSLRREHLHEVGKRVRLQDDLNIFARMLREHLPARFQLCVISASPREVVQSALEEIVPAGNVFGTEFAYDDRTGEISGMVRVPAGYGKVAVLEQLQLKLHCTPDRTIYVGDGSSDLYVMHHVNSHDGLTVAVSETKSIARIARRSVLSENALSVLVPILEERRWAGTGSKFATFSLHVESPSMNGTKSGPIWSRFSESQHPSSLTKQKRLIRSCYPQHRWGSQAVELSE